MHDMSFCDFVCNNINYLSKVGLLNISLTDTKDTFVGGPSPSSRFSIKSATEIQVTTPTSSEGPIIFCQKSGSLNCSLKL